uniref:Uncharacterized protein n=1 Tax=Anguilla anguilla TaxID=7936 RepID=A0A0E9SR18_ANGAN
MEFNTYWTYTTKLHSLGQIAGEHLLQAQERQRQQYTVTGEFNCKYLNWETKS